MKQALGKILVTKTPYTIPELGEVFLVCDRSEPAAPKLYLEVDPASWLALKDVMSGFDVSIPAPSGCAPFKHAYVTYAPGQSHPPWDFRQANGEAPGGYGVAHIDVHFMVKTVAERESLTATCTTVPGATNSFGEQDGGASRGSRASEGGWVEPAVAGVGCWGCGWMRDCAGAQRERRPGRTLKPYAAWCVEGSGRVW